MNKIGKEPCPCGHRSCKTWFLTGIGRFCQGSGFTEEEADRIVNALSSPPGGVNGEMLAALKAVEPQIGWRGDGSHATDVFYCEYCAASDADSSKILHSPTCVVTEVRAAIAKAEAAASTAAQGERESDPDLLERLGTDAAAWCKEMVDRGVVQADPAPGGWFHGWMCNAIEKARAAGHSAALLRLPAMVPGEEELAIALWADEPAGSETALRWDYESPKRQMKFRHWAQRILSRLTTEQRGNG